MQPFRPPERPRAVRLDLNQGFEGRTFFIEQTQKRLLHRSICPDQPKSFQLPGLEGQVLQLARAG
jgi:hypothetical protein